MALEMNRAIKMSHEIEDRRMLRCFLGAITSVMDALSGVHVIVHGHGGRVKLFASMLESVDSCEVWSGALERRR